MVEGRQVQLMELAAACWAAGGTASNMHGVFAAVRGLWHGCIEGSCCSLRSPAWHCMSGCYCCIGSAGLLYSNQSLVCCLMRLTDLQLLGCPLQHNACHPSAEFFNGMEELKCSSADQLRHKLPSLRSQLQQETVFRDVYNFAYMWRWVAMLTVCTMWRMQPSVR